jgi:hypothetical protein
LHSIGYAGEVSFVVVWKVALVTSQQPSITERAAQSAELNCEIYGIGE